MPFDVRCSGHERNIIQVNDLPLSSVRYCGVLKEGEAPSTASRTSAKSLLAHDPEKLALITNPSILGYC